MVLDGFKKMTKSWMGEEIGEKEKMLKIQYCTSGKCTYGSLKVPCILDIW